MEKRVESVEALALYLDEQRVGVLAHYAGSRNILSFAPEYLELPVSQRPVFTLTQKVGAEYLNKPLISFHKLPPVLSNLLSEGALREWMAVTLKVHHDDEFPLLAYAGNNLPGGITAVPLKGGEIPDWALTSRGDKLEAVQIDVSHSTDKFSLAGVQMKFSALRQDDRFNVSTDVGGDSWIIKTPSTAHRAVPENEFSAMKLAQVIGVNIPEIKLVELRNLVNLPDIPLPDEPYAYAIRRFDRTDEGRVHTEDFAQIFQVYARNKYKGYSYDDIGRALYRVGAGGIIDIQQMARRMLANILVANGDAHLKNWTVIYPNRVDAVLSPAYDIVSTKPYVKREEGVALNMAKEKRWGVINMQTFERWAERIGVPWSAVEVHLNEAIEIARERWPDLLTELPMLEEHKIVLREHWASLPTDFRL
ncbi:type II toxin-antitoxin system HipA family toxin [Rahnella victoriana]|uniref:Type II toxin-antitoxin system HipA family toxin n=1 Tax=Rahnella victoriana TaxID=1510570 RepID=A0ABS0DJY3_9GAMM|nr:type II toxin-antitoxin system HipA family toxin [Rahnella victoriana]MBF7954200.1 type II toxin-antitoxin system HipA family toxin [Rahnella victoriana]